MDVLTLYVGQGALAVVRHNGEAVIVDSLIPSQDYPSSEQVEVALRHHLKEHHVIGLVLTGLDSDHADASGVEFILGRFEPDWILYPKYFKESDEATEVFKIISKEEQRREKTGHPLRRVSVRLDKLDSRLIGGLSRQFEMELFSPHIEDMDNSNSSSVVMRVAGIGQSGFSYLVTGDTENGRWDRISELFGSALKSDVLAAPHHGSENGCHPKSVLLIQPNTVLISTGVDNQYGHPHPKAVKVYGKVASHVFSTNVHGGVSLFTFLGGTDFVTKLVDY